MEPGWGRADTAAPNLSHPGDRCQVGTGPGAWRKHPEGAHRWYRERDGQRRRAPARRAPVARWQEGRHGTRAPADEWPHLVTAGRASTARRAASAPSGRSASACPATSWVEAPVISFLVEHPGAGPAARGHGLSPLRGHGAARGVRQARRPRDQGRDHGAGRGRVGPAARDGDPAGAGEQRGDDPPPLGPRERHLRVPRRRGSWCPPPSGRRRGPAGAPRATGTGSTTTPSTGGPWTSSRPRRGLVLHLRPLVRPLRRRQRAGGVHAWSHRGTHVGDPPPERPRGAAHRRRGLHRAHDRRDRPALPDGGRASLPTLPARDPAVFPRAPRTPW